MQSEAISEGGIITATALSASIPDPSIFKSGRQFAAFLGLAPRQNSSGGKDKLGRFCKMGDWINATDKAVPKQSFLRRMANHHSKSKLEVGRNKNQIHGLLQSTMIARLKITPKSSVFAI